MGKHDSISGYTAHWGEQKWASPMYNTHKPQQQQKTKKTDVCFYCGAHYSEIRLEPSPLLFYFYANFIQRLNLNDDEANQVQRNSQKNI
jgi:hypothetical protein